MSDEKTQVFESPVPPSEDLGAFNAEELRQKLQLERRTWDVLKKRTRLVAYADDRFHCQHCGGDLESEPVKDEPKEERKHKR